MVRLQSQVIKGENADIKLADEMLICVQTLLQVLRLPRKEPHKTKTEPSPLGFHSGNSGTSCRLIGHSLRGQDQV